MQRFEFFCLILVIATLHVTVAGCVKRTAENGPFPAMSADSTGPVSQREPPPTDYVGSAVCASCHREISDQYASHPMGRSSGQLADVPVIETYGDSAQFLARDGKRYRIERHEHEIVHHEELLDDHSEVLYDQGVPMELSIGSGRRGRSYAYRRGDRFFMSPISWYSKSQIWDLSPGYQPGRHQRFDRLLTERCLVCHTGQTNLEAAPDTWSHDLPIVEHSISCERCHGPASSHVAHHQRPEEFQGVDRIVNPSKLDAFRRDAVCHQCHFQSGRTFPRPGLRPSDFRPGDRLTDIYVVMPTPPSERRAVSQSEQMLTSACYQKSQGKFGCISCHNPHSLPTGDTAVAFDRKCASCHSDQTTNCSEAPSARSDKSCISCHMPQFDTKDVPHTALTDHRILKRPQLESNSDAVEQVFQEGEPQLPEWEYRRAQALNLRTDRRLVRGPHDLERAVDVLRGLTQRLPDDPEIWESLAWYDARLGKWKDVEVSAGKALELTPRRIESLELLVGALAARSAWTEVAAQCEILLKRDDQKSFYHNMLAESAWHLGDLERGMAAAERSLACDPTQIELRRRLSFAYEELGNFQLAEHHRKIVEQLSRPLP